MHIILIPGLWLDGSSWDDVLPHLEAAGHTPHPLTLPGMESRDADRSGVTLEDHVDAVVAAIDAADPADGPVLVVGHSAASALAFAAVDARPDRVARGVYVGGFPGADGEALVGWATPVDGEIPFPGWSEFDDADVQDLDEQTRKRFVERAIPSPGRLATDELHLTDERRYEVPATAICPEYTPEQLRAWIADGEPPVQEFARIREVDYVDLPTGHWPQLTNPRALAEAIAAAAEH